MVSFSPTNRLLVSVEFRGDLKTVTKLRYIWPPTFLGYTGFKTVVRHSMRLYHIIFFLVSLS